MSDQDKQAAIFYWQDKLAKFFPTSKGPSGVEVDMFLAGVRQERERIQSEFLSMALDSDRYSFGLVELETILNPDGGGEG